MARMRMLQGLPQEQMPVGTGEPQIPFDQTAMPPMEPAGPPPLPDMSQAVPPSSTQPGSLASIGAGMSTDQMSDQSLAQDPSMMLADPALSPQQRMMIEDLIMKALGGMGG